MNNVLMRRIVLTTAYQPLGREVASVTVRMPASNKQTVVFEGEDGAQVGWDKSTQFELKRVNLAEIKVKGRTGDLVVLAGGTW